MWYFCTFFVVVQTKTSLQDQAANPSTTRPRVNTLTCLTLFNSLSFDADVASGLIVHSDTSPQTLMPASDDLPTLPYLNTTSTKHMFP